MSGRVRARVNRTDTFMCLNACTVSSQWDQNASTWLELLNFACRRGRRYRRGGRGTMMMSTRNSFWFWSFYQPSERGNSAIQFSLRKMICLARIHNGTKRRTHSRCDRITPLYGMVNVRCRQLYNYSSVTKTIIVLSALVIGFSIDFYIFRWLHSHRGRTAVRRRIFCLMNLFWWTEDAQSPISANDVWHANDRNAGRFNNLLVLTSLRICECGRLGSWVCNENGRCVDWAICALIPTAFTSHSWTFLNR